MLHYFIKVYIKEKVIVNRKLKIQNLEKRSLQSVHVLCALLPLNNLKELLWVACFYWHKLVSFKDEQLGQLKVISHLRHPPFPAGPSTLLWFAPKDLRIELITKGNLWCRCPSHARLHLAIKPSAPGGDVGKSLWAQGYKQQFWPLQKLSLPTHHLSQALVKEITSLKITLQEGFFPFKGLSWAVSEPLKCSGDSSAGLSRVPVHSPSTAISRGRRRTAWDRPGILDPHTPVLPLVI